MSEYAEKNDPVSVVQQDSSQGTTFSYDDYLNHFLQNCKTFFESGKVFEEVYNQADQDTRLRAAYDAAEKKGVSVSEMTKAWNTFKQDRESGKTMQVVMKDDKEIAQIMGRSAVRLVSEKDSGSDQHQHADAISFEDAQKVVEEFDADSFESAVPYDLIASMNDDTSRSRLKYVARKKAKSVGFPMKDFDDMCKARLTDQKRMAADDAEQKKRENRENAIQSVKDSNVPLGGISDLFDDIVPDVGEYIFSEKGIYYYGFFGLVKVCSHPLFPSKRSINIESGTELMDISYKIDNQWKTAKLIDRKTISQSRLIPELSKYGMDITSENAKEVVKFLADMDSRNRSIIPRSDTVNRLGWIPARGFSPYIPGVTYDSGGKYREIYATVHEKGSFEKWKSLAGMVMENKKYIAARIVLAASVASVLLPWTCGQSFIIDHWSPESGTGKTVTSMLGASVWADPFVGKYIRPMNSTIVGFEQTAAFCNNLPLILDERQSLRVDPQDLIYMLCEGSGKSRGAKDGGLRDQAQWLNITITNGEQPLTFSIKSGIINRVISIESHGQVIPGNMAEFADTLCENYGFAGKKIIERLQENNDQMQQIKEAYKHTASELMKSVTGKQANYGAAILVGDIFLDAIVFDGKYRKNLLNKDDILPFLATPGMIDINAKIRRWLCGFVASEEQHFIRTGKSSADTDIRTRLYGQKETDGSVLFIAETLKEELEQHDWDYGAFMRWCDERGLIKTNYKASSRHWDVGATIAQNSVRVIHFLPAMFQDDDHPIAEQTVLS